MQPTGKQILNGRLHRLVLVDEDARAVLQLHAERHRHAQHLWLTFRLEQRHDRHRHAVLEAPVLGDDADLLAIGVRALAADLHPRRIHQLRLALRLTAAPCCGPARLAPPGRRLGGRLLGAARRPGTTTTAVSAAAVRLAASARPHGRADAFR